MRLYIAAPPARGFSAVARLVPQKLGRLAIAAALAARRIAHEILRAFIGAMFRTPRTEFRGSFPKARVVVRPFAPVFLSLNAIFGFAAPPIEPTPI